jgi:hypothetical protein
MKSASPAADALVVTKPGADDPGEGFGGSAMSELELLVSEAFDEGVISEVIRPAAILPEACARAVLVELALRDVNNGGNWHAQPSVWRRYDRPWDGANGAEGSSALLGSIQVAYGTPTRYEITIYRATITRLGSEHDWTVETLCDEALGYGGLDLAGCPRADMRPPPEPFRFPGPRA